MNKDNCKWCGHPLEIDEHNQHPGCVEQQHLIDLAWKRKMRNAKPKLANTPWRAE